MPSRILRTLVIALLAALQLVLQPLAGTRGCAFAVLGEAGCGCRAALGQRGTSEDCCCESGSSHHPDAPEAPHSKRAPCHCSAPPALPATLPSDAVTPSPSTWGSERLVDLGRPLFTSETLLVSALAASCAGGRRDRGGGVWHGLGRDRPLRVWLRVFRL